MSNYIITTEDWGHYNISRRLCENYSVAVALTYFSVSQWCKPWSKATNKEYNGRLYYRVPLWAIAGFVPCISERQVSNALRVLRDEEIIDCVNLNVDKREHTLWYTILGDYE